MADRVLRVDPAACVGSGTCTNVAPTVFALDGETGVARVVGRPEEALEDVEEAISICPVEAIAWDGEEAARE
jgi:ferredoxin